MPDLSGDPRTAAVVRAYESLQRDTLADLLDLYDAQARFKDPFNEVQGRAAIERIFVHMFDTLVEPRFVVETAATEGRNAFLVWTFHCRRAASPKPLALRGATHLAFDGDGRVTLHRDYWDAAEELYARLPIVGALMRWLRRRFTTPPTGR